MYTGFTGLVIVSVLALSAGIGFGLVWWGVAELLANKNKEDSR